MTNSTQDVSQKVKCSTDGKKVFFTMQVMPILYKKVCRKGGSVGWWGQLSAGRTVLLCPDRQDAEQEVARQKSTRRVEAQRGRKRGGGQVPDAKNMDVDAAEEEEADEGCTFRVQGTGVAEKFPTAPKPHAHTVSDISRDDGGNLSSRQVLGKGGRGGREGKQGRKDIPLRWAQCFLQNCYLF